MILMKFSLDTTRYKYIKKRYYFILLLDRYLDSAVLTHPYIAEFHPRGNLLMGKVRLWELMEDQSAEEGLSSFYGRHKAWSVAKQNKIKRLMVI